MRRRTLTDEHARRHRLNVLRASLTIAGALVMLVGLLADWIGLGEFGSFGTDQALLTLVGLGAVLLGLLGYSRAVALYRGAAILLLNTLVLLILLELGVGFAISVETRLSSSGALPTRDGRAELPYYASQDWAETYWQEFTSIKDRKTDYHPWVIWRRPPFEGKTIHVDQDGLRQTPGADCGPTAYRVFAFGGSTMWGAGAPDWGTIPAYLQADLEPLRNGPVCVVNYGNPAYVSTQGVIELFTQLRSGNMPDMVIFYDGINDVLAASQSGQPGVHMNLDETAARFEEQKAHPLIEWLTSFQSFRLFESLVGGLRPQGPTTYLDSASPQATDIASLANSIVQIYLGNYRIVNALAQEYGFEYAFFWQPVILVGEKPLTIEERRIRENVSPAMVDLFDATYQKMAKVAPEHETLHSMAHVFDEQESQIWIDRWHVTPVGNQLIAQQMLKTLQYRSATK